MSSLLACFSLVASLYHLPPRVLPSIMQVESGQQSVIHRNHDGSEDLGPMQINTRWLPVLSLYFAMDPREIRQRLLDGACFSVASAGAIMRGALDETGGDLMRAIGNYHSHTPTLNQAYQLRVAGAAAHLFAAPVAPP